MQLKTEKFKELIKISEFIPTVEMFMEPDKYLFFLRNTSSTGLLPEVTQEELTKIVDVFGTINLDNISFNLCNRTDDKLGRLSEEALAEIRENMLEINNEFQLKNYLKYLATDLGPVIYAMNKLNYIETIKKDNLYIMPVCLTKPVESTDNEILREAKEDVAVSAAKINNYSLQEKELFKALCNLFSLFLYSYDCYKQIIYEMESIAIDSGLPETFIDEEINGNYSLGKPPETREASTHESTLTRRHEAIIYLYKATCGYIPNVFRPKEIQDKYGVGLKKAIYTVWSPKGKTYKKPTSKELKRVIPHLAAFPNAKKASVNDLDDLIKRGL